MKEPGAESYTIKYVLNEAAICPTFNRVILTSNKSDVRKIQIINQSNIVAEFSDYLYHSPEKEVIAPDNIYGAALSRGDNAVFVLEIAPKEFMAGTIDEIFESLSENSSLDDLVSKAPMLAGEIAAMLDLRTLAEKCLETALNLEGADDEIAIKSIFEIFLERDLEHKVSFLQSRNSEIAIHVDTKKIRISIHGKLQTSEIDIVAKFLNWCKNDKLWRGYDIAFEVLTRAGRRPIATRNPPITKPRMSKSTIPGAPRLTGLFVNVARRRLGFSIPDFAKMVDLSSKSLERIESNNRNSIGLALENKINKILSDTYASGQELSFLYKEYSALRSRGEIASAGTEAAEASWRRFPSDRTSDADILKFFSPRADLVYIGFLQKEFWQALYVNPTLTASLSPEINQKIEKLNIRISKHGQETLATSDGAYEMLPDVIDKKIYTYFEFTNEQNYTLAIGLLRKIVLRSTRSSERENASLFRLMESARKLFDL